MTTTSSFAGRALLASAALVVSQSCTFPEYVLPGETTSATTSSAGGASGSTSATTTKSASSATTGTMGSGGDTTSSTGTTMAPTCSQPCDTSMGATCKKACDATPDPECDCDGDGQIIDTANCKAANPSAQIDCYDCNPDAKKGVTTYFIVDRGDGEFDYDCNNSDDAQYGIDCGVGQLTCSKPYVYDTNPGCGNDGNLHSCDVPVALSCKKEAPFNVTAQACH